MIVHAYLTPVLVVLGGALGISGVARAQGYPEKPVRVISALGAGGAVDAVGRLVAARLSENLQRQFVVENRLGGGGTIGYAYVAKAPRDGYTLLVAGSGYTIASVIYQVQYDPFRDIAPLAQVTKSSYVLVTHPALPARSARELVALARSKPGALNYGTAGVGSAVHFAMETFAIASGTRMTHVPYRSAAHAQSDLVSGELQVMMTNIISVLPHVVGNRLRAVGVSSAKRSPILPAVPTMTEAGVPYTRSGYTAYFAPAGVSPDIVRKLQTEIGKVLADPAVAKTLADSGGEQAEPIEAFAQSVRTDLELNRKIALAKNIKAD
jgi:tripartite-type tricarboxylate transporter receptor subunit TctC